MSSTYQKQALKSIKNQIGDQPPNQVYVIELDGIPFEEITLEMKHLLETCSALQMLTINNCTLTSLQNFPYCPALIRLDLISNKLKGSDLNYLQNIRHIQTLYLSQNEFNSIHDFNQIAHMRKLLQLNLSKIYFIKKTYLVGNDICDVQDYEKQMFSIFPSLKILDGYDRDQKYPSQQNLLKESVNRINKNLFESSAPKPIAAPVPPIKSLFSAPLPLPIKPAIVSAPAKKIKISKKEENKKDNKKLIKSTKKMDVEKPLKKKIFKRQIKNLPGSQIFPKGRVTRHLRQRLPTFRISPKSAVFLTGCVEYLCYELLEIASEEAKNAKKKRIMPEHIIQAVKKDKEFNETLKNVTVAGKPLL